MRNFFWLCFTNLATGLIAQTPSYLHYDVGDGLPSALVYCIEQDRQGFLWFGTDKGLARFDGIRFKTYGMKDGLPDPDVISLLSDSRGRLWIYSFRKKPAYRENGRFVSEREDSLLAKVDLQGSNLNFFEDEDSAVWIGGEVPKFCRITPDKAEVFHSKGAIRGAFNIGKEHFAMATTEIFRILDDGSFQAVFALPLSYQAGGSFSFAVHQKRVLLSYSNQVHLLEYNGARFLHSDYLPNAGGAASQDREGNFCISSPIFAKALRFKNKHNLDQPEEFLPGKRASFMMEDRDGTLWFATLNEGVYALPKNAVVTYSRSSHPEFVSDNILSLSAFPDGSIVAGDDAGNLYFRRVGRWKTTPLLEKGSYNRVRQILSPDLSGWLVASDMGVFSPTGMLGSDQKYLFGAPKAVYQRKGIIWVGTSHALYSWQAGKKTQEGDAVTRVTAIGADANDNIWVGGLNNLLSEKDHFNTRWGDRFPQLATRIIGIQPGGPDAIWVATPGDGLLRVQVKAGEATEVEVMNERLKQPIQNIQSLFVEPNGVVWLATNSGVYSIDKDLKVNHFDEKSGLANNDVNAVLVVGDTLWAATASGLSQLLLRQPQVTGNFHTWFSALRYQSDGKTVSLDLVDTLPPPHRSVTLPPGAALLELDLAALDFRNRGNFSFEFSTTETLLPFRSLTWGNLFSRIGSLFRPVVQISLTEEPRRNFGVNLTPGSYLVRLTAIKPGGIRSLQPDELSLTILPHWTKTLWFSLAVWCLIVFIIWRLILANNAFRKLKQTASELQLQAIKSQINPHFIGNSINAIQQFFYPPDPVKASEYISIFTDLLRRTMFLSERNFTQFEEEMRYVEDYLKMIQLRFGDRFRYTITGVETIPIDTPFPTMILQPILENSTIHGLAPTGNSMLEIHFKFGDEKHLTCTVTDNGVGIQVSKERKKSIPSKRVSKGIYLLEQKIQMLNKLEQLDLSLEIMDLSESGTGTHGTTARLSFYPQKISIQPTKPG